MSIGIILIYKIIFAVKKRPRKTGGGGYSALADKLFPAAGTGNGNLALTPGNADGLLALGTVEIPVIPVPDPIHALEEFPVLLITLVGVAGQRTENGPEHQGIGDAMEDQVGQGAADKQSQNDHHQGGTQNRTVQFVAAIAAFHKTPEGIGGFCAELAEPASESVHKITFVTNSLLLYIIV